jgi:hypothetical protein
MYLICKTNRIFHRNATYTTCSYGDGISLILLLLTRTFGSQGKPVILSPPSHHSLDPWTELRYRPRRTVYKGEACIIPVGRRLWKDRVAGVLVNEHAV